eukprot:403357618
MKNNSQNNSKRTSVDNSIQSIRKTNSQFTTGEKRWSVQNGVTPNQKPSQKTTSHSFQPKMSSSSAYTYQQQPNVSSSTELRASSKTNSFVQQQSSNINNQVMVEKQRQSSSNRNSMIVNKKYSLDERNNDNYVYKLQEFTQEGNLEFKQRKYSMQTDNTISTDQPVCTPVYSHNYPNRNVVSPFYFHNNNMMEQQFNQFNGSAIDSKNDSLIQNHQQFTNQVEPQTIQIVEEIVIPNYRQHQNKAPNLFNNQNSHLIQQQNNGVISQLQNLNQLQPQMIYAQINKGDNTHPAKQNSSSFYSNNNSSSSLKGSFSNFNSNNVNPGINVNCSFSGPITQSGSLVQQNQQCLQNMNTKTTPNIQMANSHSQCQQQLQQQNFDSQSCHSSYGMQSVISQSLPCQCTQCLQAQMAYLQSLLVQQQQLYFQQQQDSLNESINSQGSNCQNFKKGNSNMLIQTNQQQPIINLQQHRQSLVCDSKSSVISNSCPSHEDESIPDEILSLKSDDNNSIPDSNNPYSNFEREQRIIRDQIELQRHYETYMQQELINFQEDENYQSRFLPELNIDPNPQNNILKKNYIELPLGEIPEMKESFYEDQSRYTNSSMSKRPNNLQQNSIIFGSQTFNEYNNFSVHHTKDRSSCKKKRQSIDSNGILLTSGKKFNQNSIEKENLKQIEILNESFPIKDFTQVSRNSQNGGAHTRNLSLQNPNISQASESQPFLNQFGSIVTPHKSRQLSGSNWGTTINKDLSEKLMFNTFQSSSKNQIQLVQQQQQSMSKQNLQTFPPPLHQYQEDKEQEQQHHRRHSSGFRMDQLMLQEFNNNFDKYQKKTDEVPKNNELQQQQEQTKRQSRVAQVLDFSSKHENLLNSDQQSYQIADVTEQQMFVKEFQTSSLFIQDPSDKKTQEQKPQNTQSSNNNSFDSKPMMTDASAVKQHRDLSQSIRNQSYEKDKADKLINYILDQDQPYYQQTNGSRSRRNNGKPLGTQNSHKKPLSSKKKNSKIANTSSSQHNDSSSLHRYQSFFKTMDSDTKSDNKVQLDVQPIQVAPFRFTQNTLDFENNNSQQRKKEHSDLQQNYFQMTPDIQAQINQNQNDEVYRVQQAHYSQISQQTQSLATKELRSRSVEPRNGRIFQKYSAFQQAKQSLQKPQTRRQSNSITKTYDHENINSRWSSLPSQRKQKNLVCSIDPNHAYKQKQTILVSKRSTQPIQILQKPLTSIKSSQDQQNTINRLTQQFTGQVNGSSNVRGKNQKQSALRQQPRQSNKGQNIIIPQITSSSEVFERLATTGKSSRKTRVEQNMRHQMSQGKENVVVQTIQHPIQQQQSRYQQKQNLQPMSRYSKTLFEMSELPSYQNIQRSISAKRQQNQLIVSIAKRKSSVLSKGDEQDYQQDFYSAIKNQIQTNQNLRDKENRRSIESAKNYQLGSSIKKSSNVPSKVISYSGIKKSSTYQPSTLRKQGDFYAHSARQTMSSSQKRTNSSINKSNNSRNQNIQQSSSSREPKHVVINIKNTKKTLFSQSVEKPRSTQYDHSVSPINTNKNLQNLNQTSKRYNNFEQTVQQNSAFQQTPQVKPMKLSNHSDIMNTLQGCQEESNTGIQTVNTQNNSERNSIYKNPFQNSNLASYRESFLIPAPQNHHNKQQSGQFSKQAYEMKMYNASLFQNYISSQVQPEYQEIQVEDQYDEVAQNESQNVNYDQDSDKNEIEFILSENHKSLNMNEINEIQQSAEIQRKINEYYKLKEQQERQIRDLHSKQEMLQSLQKEQNGKDLNFILNQLEKADRSRISTVQGFTSFNTFEQPEFTSFNSANNPYQMPQSLMNTMDRQQPPQQNQNQKITPQIIFQESHVLKAFDSGANLIQTPISKEISTVQSERVQSSADKNTKRPQLNMCSSPNSQKQQNNQNIKQNAEQNLCVPSALFFNNTTGHISRKSQHSSYSRSDQQQTNSDIDVLRQSTDNSPQIFKKDKNHQFLQQCQNSNSKNESSIIIKSFGMDPSQQINFDDSQQIPQNITQPLNHSLNQSNKQPSYNNKSKPNIPPPKYSQNRNTVQHNESLKLSQQSSSLVNQLTPKSQSQQSPSNIKSQSVLIMQQNCTNYSHKSSNSQLSQYKADDEDTNSQNNLNNSRQQQQEDQQLRESKIQQFRTLKLSQDEKQILRERVDQHRRSLNRKDM